MNIVRPPHIAEQVVFVDSLPALGKTMPAMAILDPLRADDEREYSGAA